jgi:hypothetical protein
MRLYKSQLLKNYLVFPPNSFNSWYPYQTIKVPLPFVTLSNHYILLPFSKRLIQRIAKIGEDAQKNKPAT